VNVAKPIKSLLTLAFLLVCIVFAARAIEPAGQKIYGKFSLTVTKTHDVPFHYTPLAVAWSPDSSALVVTSNYGSNLTILDRSGNKLTQVRNVSGAGYGEDSLVAFVNGASQVLFHPSDKADATTVFDVRDAVTGQIVKPIEGSIPTGKGVGSNRPWAFAVSHDQKLAAVITAGWFVITYDAKDWRKLHLMDRFKEGVALSICFSADGKELAIGHTDGITIIDPISGKVIRKIEAYHSKYGITGIASMAMSPDGKFLLTIAGYGAESGSINRAEACHLNHKVAGV